MIRIKRVTDSNLKITRCKRPTTEADAKASAALEKEGPTVIPSLRLGIPKVESMTQNYVE